LGYLFAAYAAVWIGIVVYVRSIERRTRDLEDELHDLRQRRGTAVRDPSRAGVS
jgi:CcmD family protein